MTGGSGRQHSPEEALFLHIPIKTLFSLVSTHCDGSKLLGLPLSRDGTPHSLPPVN